MVNFIDPVTKAKLILKDDTYYNSSGDIVASIINGLPRFVPYNGSYDRSFGWQWNQWDNIRSSSRGSGLGLEATVLERTKFDQFNLHGKTILECGMGGGDDTEILLKLPFSEIHAFDVSNSVDRAAKYLNDSRLVISQASIFDMPYPDYAFDVVYCHRVLQHTPDPQKALASICKKVKQNGILFAHAYKRSKRNMAEWRYKYRWITKRVPIKWVYLYVSLFGPFLHRLNQYMYTKNRWTQKFAYQFIPFYQKTGVPNMLEKDIIELEKLITFDALTPRYDSPMTPDVFFGTIEENGFKIQHKYDPPVSPLYCTAIRKEIK